MLATETVKERPQVSVIVPARNEEACLADCLQSLVAQTGVDFEIIVVDDHSTDRTREIAESFPGVRVIEAGPLPAGWTGKNNAVTTGAREARGQWLLFTDADTVHLPGSLAAAVKEARENGAELALLFSRADRGHVLGNGDAPRSLRRTGPPIFSVESERPRFAHRRRQRTIHSDSPRRLMKPSEATPRSPTTSSKT